MIDPVLITRVKIPLLIKTGVLGNMDLMVRRMQAAICIDNNRSIVMTPVRGSLVYRYDNDNPGPLRDS